MRRIDPSRTRFIDIAKGRIKRQLLKYLDRSKTMIINRKGKKATVIKFPRLDLNDFFRFNESQGGVGQGEGNVGDDLGRIDGKPDQGTAGEGEGDHILIEFDEPEMFELLQAHLPNIKPKGKSKIPKETEKYRTVRKMGPESLRLKKRTFKQALKSSIATGEYVPGAVPIPTRKDRRYRGLKTIEESQFNALLVFMRDISGSISEEQRELISMICFMAEIWLKGNYKQLETAYLVHDYAAGEAKDQDQFLSASSGGGTKISSVHRALVKLIDERYPPRDWNIYPIYFSDGDNWGSPEDWSDDTFLCCNILDEQIIPVVNQYAYAQLEGQYGKGEFIYALQEAFSGNRQVIWSNLNNDTQVLKVFQKFFGKKNLGEVKEEVES